MPSGVCQLITCPGGQIYNSLTARCSCPTGLFLVNGGCASCPANCFSCGAAGCTQCQSRFYNRNGICAACISNCLRCTNALTCIQCDYHFRPQEGVCVRSASLNGAVKLSPNSSASCPPGCASCSLNSSQIVCSQAADGFSFNSAGNLAHCHQTCKTCAPSSVDSCTSCWEGNRLQGT